MLNPKYPRLPVLIIDDEEDVLQSYKMTLQYNGINNLILCEDSRRVMTILSVHPVSCILMDLSMPHITGHELIVKIRDQHPDIPLTIITGINDVTTAVDCMKNGVFDYMVKPVEKSRLISGVKHAIEMQDLHHEVDVLSRQLLTNELDHPAAFASIITQSSAMQSIFKYLEAVATSPRTVLITGESGVGKELVAKAIHTLSEREGRFVTVNVGGLDDTMFSDTLFGHSPGAFTDAKTGREGLIEKAAGGTLFLDEIGEMGSGSQVKLLRLLQEKEYYQLGSDIPRLTDVRIIAATNADMPRQVEKGAMRKDLYYRLMSHPVRIPPLRNRLEDLPLLVNHFCEAATESLGRPKLLVPREISALLASYHFPGNVRELESMVFDIVSRTTGDTLTIGMFKEYIRKSTPGDPGQVHAPVIFDDRTIFYVGDIPTLHEVENFFIKEALDKCKGNQLLAAKMLGISQSKLSRRQKERRGEPAGEE
jgi:DNA-binding NtrC family response regulator